ncbi:MAG TPA: ATP-dependent DNA helicase [Candidatus Limnocylindria bacterium]|nr:ATP-dependent DNA helicase [Candidatus Limnocylindria bacterium]
MIELTDEQRAAVEWGDGPLMVLAGAGTGKTTVIVERVRHLLATDSSLQPENLLVLTYNVKAAAELVDRLEEMLGLELASRLWVHNFHSFGHRLLSDNRAELGLEENADVLDTVGQRLLLRELRPKLGHFLYHPLARNPAGADRFADVISRAKDELITPEEYLAFAQARREAFEFEHGHGSFEEVVESLRKRDAEGNLWPVGLVRRELARNDRDATWRVARRESRRQAYGSSEELWWAKLSQEQERLAQGLQPTFLRDAQAYDILRLIEEAEAYAVYQRALRERGLLDFGEQQLRAIQLLTDRPNILARYQGQFRHVLVDEFQDANMAQILLLELIGRGPDKPDNVVVVGDDDQSIYRFRGASYAAFERFRERFEQPPSWAPERTSVAVERRPLLANRRSTGRILSAAERLIEHNGRRLKSEPLRPIKEQGTPVDVLYATDETDEADYVVGWIGRTWEALPQPRRWSDIAVLYRKHRHRDLIVERLRAQGIPYVVIGGTGLFAVPEVRDVEAALRVASNPDDSVAFVRLLSAGPWRLDASEILRLTRAADWDGRPVFQAAADILREGELPVPVVEPATPGPAGNGALPTTLWPDDQLTEDGQAADEPATVRDRRSREQRTAWRREALDVRLRTKLARLFELLDALVPRGRRDGPFAVLEDHLVRTNLLHDLIATETVEAQRTLLALARFMRFVADWQRAHPGKTLADFVAYLDVYQAVGGDLDTDVPGRVDVEGVQLMTVYQAKGLEYEAVAVPRLVEGQFPDTREEQRLIPLELLKQVPPADFAIDEERRLLFVAMTRAKARLLLSAVDAPGSRTGPSRFVGELLGDDAPPDLAVERREPPPQPEVEPGAASEEVAAATTTEQLLKLMPLPRAQERRFALRRRAVEIIGLLEGLSADDHAARASLTQELVSVAEDAAGLAQEARRNGLDPLTLTVLSRHSPAGSTLLELAPLPGTFSHSQMSTYLDCPLRYAFEKVYRIPSGETRGYFEFGGTIHQAFETYTRARREAVAAGLPPPGYETLRQAFDTVWQPRNYEDAQAAQHYRTRAEPALRRFYDREVASLAEAVAFEIGFTLELEDPAGGPQVRFYGVIDRIDRHPDGTIEITDYKTGRTKKQADVDADGQLSAYALALAMGAVRDPATGDRLPPASKLTLYFTESDQALSTTRTLQQLDEFKATLLATARRIRGGDFTATPDQWRCGRCDYRLICPSRWGTDRVV